MRLPDDRADGGREAASAAAMKRLRRRRLRAEACSDVWNQRPPDGHNAAFEVREHFASIAAKPPAGARPYADLMAPALRWSHQAALEEKPVAAQRWRIFVFDRQRLALGAAIIASAATLACGGAGDQPSSTSGVAQLPTTADGATADGATADPVDVVDAVAPRGDGLTGAPVPVLEAQSAEFDASRLNQTAGRFPPLDDPTIVSADEAPWLEAETLVLGAIQNGEARAYPIAMMTFHHVANDVLGGEPYLVTF